MQIVLLVQICIADEVNQQKTFWEKVYLRENTFSDGCKVFCKVKLAEACCSITLLHAYVSHNMIENSQRLHFVR